MSRFVPLRLAIVNATGFAATTIMPLWLGSIAARFDAPAWYAGLAVLLLVAAAAGLNLLASALPATADLQTVARAALIAAAAGQLVAGAGSPAAFLIGCAVAGAGSGVLLNVTNRAMGSAEHVQRGYAVFVIVEVCFATVLFISCSELIGRFGLLAAFPALAAATLIGLPILGSLLRGMTPGAPEERTTEAVTGRAGLGLLALALFFIGQAALNSFMPLIGGAAGLDPAAAGRAIGLGMPFGLLGALLARLLGERVSPLVVIGTVATALAAAGLLLTSGPTPPLFTAAAVTLAISTMLCVPYFFAVLGSHDAHGRFTALGPAMMLAGIGLGPATAVLLNGWAGLAAVGWFSAALLILAGLAFAVSTGPAASLRRSRRPG